jgi:hypothetical protein
MDRRRGFGHDSRRVATTLDVMSSDKNGVEDDDVQEDEN